MYPALEEPTTAAAPRVDGGATLLPPPPPPPPLPPGWEAHVDQASGFTYFVHGRTGETSFERPPRDADGDSGPSAPAGHADLRRSFPTIAGLNAAQQTAVRAWAFIASIEELRAIPFELLHQRIRISRSPDGSIVPLRANYVAEVTACYRGQMYNDDWLRFSGGAMHFLTQAGAVLPVTLEPPAAEAATPAIGAAEPAPLPLPSVASYSDAPASRVRRVMNTASEALFGTAAVDAHVANAVRNATRTRELASHRMMSDAIGATVCVDATAAPRQRPAERHGPFATAAAATAAAAAIVPPVWQPDAPLCARCSQGFGLLRRRTHCRNCGHTHCHDCCTTWPRAAFQPSYLLPSESTRFPRVCFTCDANATAFRLALLAGDLAAVRAAYADGQSNVNLRSPLSFQGEAQMLPVHLAAVGGSLPVLRWLAEEMHCPVVGPQALTGGKTTKTVLRVAIERVAVDVMQWLVGADDAAAHTGLPVSMPLETGCAPAAVHRALEAALREGWRQRALVTLTLSQLPAAAAEPPDGACGAAAEPPEAAARRPLLYPSAADLAAERPSERERECVVCLAAPRDHVLVPCGHACCCDECCAAISFCPLCRAPVEKAVKLYDS